MNSRRFILVLCSILLVLLIVSGTLAMRFINSRSPSNNVDSKESILDPFIPPKQPINLLVMGGDKFNNNTDTMLLMNFDPSTANINILSIPRDTEVIIEDEKRKINFAYPRGIHEKVGARLAVETVSDLLKVKIKYCVYIDIAVFRKIIDRLGGIKDFNVPVDMDYDDPWQDLHIHLDKGIQFLDGSKAEQFMRFRKGTDMKKVEDFYDGSDTKRIDAQQLLIKELIRQKSNIYYIPRIKGVIQDIFGSLETNIKLSEVLKLSKNINNFKSQNMRFFILPGVPVEEELSYYECDKEKTLEITRQYFKAEGVYVDSKYDDVEYNMNTNQ